MKDMQASSISVKKGRAYLSVINALTRRYQLPALRYWISNTTCQILDSRYYHGLTPIKEHGFRPPRAVVKIAALTDDLHQ